MRSLLVASLSLSSFVLLSLESPHSAAAEEAPRAAASTSSPPDPEGIPARADGRAFSVCGTESLEDLAKGVTPSMVEAEGSAMWSLGFVFGEPDLVLVPLAVAEAGRGVVVRQRGRALSATVAAIDDASELALLRVPGLEQARPLAPSPIAPTTGVATVVPARPWNEEGAADQVTSGTVTATQGQRFRTSSRVAFGFDVGGPVLDCRGRVLGVTTWMGDEAVKIDRANAMLARVRAGEAPYEGRWSVAHPSFHALLEIDGDVWGGADFGLALVGRDRWEIGLDARVLATGKEPTEDAAGWVSRPWGVRGGADLRAGARLMLTEGAMPIYVVPHVGFGFDVTGRGVERMRGAVESSDCTPEDPCPVLRDADPVPTSIEARALPQVGLGVRWGFVELGYTFRLDVAQPKASGHQIGLGIQF